MTDTVDSEKEISSPSLTGALESKRLTSRPIEAGLILSEVTSEEFLPSVRPWVSAVGLAMVGSFVIGVALMAIWPYKVVVRGSGQIRPSGETSVINAPLTGRVRALNVRSNQNVHKGQVLALLDPSDLEGKQKALASSRQAMEQQRQALESQAEAAVLGAEQEVEKAQAALVLAEAEFNRFIQLRDSGAIAPLILDEKTANLDVARANVAKALRAVEEVRSSNKAQLSKLAQDVAANSGERAQVRRTLGITQVRAPVSGVIFSLNLFNPQQVVQEGQELARIAPTRMGMVAKVLVSSEDVSNLRPGQRTDLRLAGCPYPDFGTLRGSVFTVSPDVIQSRGPERDLRTGQPTPSAVVGYEVTVVPNKTELRAGGRRCNVRLGMDLVADITTRQETVLSFLLRKARLLIGT